MAQPTNTFDRYDSVGVREQLIEKITMTSPEETPVVSALGTVSSFNTFYEYQRDTLATPNADNAAIDGDDTAATAVTPTVRVGNYHQIIKRVTVISGRADAVRTAGRNKETTYQKAKTYKELKRDVEAAVVSKNAAVLGNSTTAMKMGGFGVHLYTNALHNGAGATASHTSGAPTTAVTAGTNRTFTGTLLETAMQNTYTNSGMTPPMVVMSPAHKVTFASFSGIAANRVNQTSAKEAIIVAGADVYQSNFGRLTVVPHYMMASKNYVLGIHPEYADIAYLRGYRSKELGPTGDSMKTEHLVDASLAVRSEKCMFKIDDLTP